jgi:hypothetical protein
VSLVAVHGVLWPLISRAVLFSGCVLLWAVFHLGCVPFQGNDVMADDVKGDYVMVMN